MAARFMRSICHPKLAAALGALAGLLTPLIAYAAGGPPVGKLVNVADTRGLEGGLVKMIGDIYNQDLWLFGLLVVVVMAGMGGALGFIFDRLMGLLGINLGKLHHDE